jgi:hypothetical protein
MNTSKQNRTASDRAKRKPWSRSEINGTIGSIVALIGCVVALITFTDSRFHYRTEQPETKKANQQSVSSAGPANVPATAPAPHSTSPVVQPRLLVPAAPQQLAELRDRLKTLAVTIARVSSRCQQVREDNKRTPGVSGELPIDVQSVLDNLQLDEKAAQHAMDSGDLETAKRKIVEAESKLEPGPNNNPLDLCNF